jgi:hypothetical protein
MGYFPVLAVNAPERTPGEKNSAGSVPAGNRRFFPQMGGNPADQHIVSQAAEAGGQRTVGAARTGTKPAAHL